MNVLIDERDLLKASLWMKKTLENGKGKTMFPLPEYGAEILDLLDMKEEDPRWEQLKNAAQNVYIDYKKHNIKESISKKINEEINEDKLQKAEDTVLNYLIDLTIEVDEIRSQYKMIDTKLNKVKRAIREEKAWELKGLKNEIVELLSAVGGWGESVLKDFDDYTRNMTESKMKITNKELKQTIREELINHFLLQQLNEDNVLNLDDYRKKEEKPEDMGITGTVEDIDYFDDNKEKEMSTNDDFEGLDSLAKIDKAVSNVMLNVDAHKNLDFLDKVIAGGSKEEKEHLRSSLKSNNFGLESDVKEGEYEDFTMKKFKSTLNRGKPSSGGHKEDSRNLRAALSMQDVQDKKKKQK